MRPDPDYTIEAEVGLAGKRTRLVCGHGWNLPDGKVKIDLALVPREEGGPMVMVPNDPANEITRLHNLVAEARGLLVAYETTPATRRAFLERLNNLGIFCCKSCGERAVKRPDLACDTCQLPEEGA